MYFSTIWSLSALYVSAFVQALSPVPPIGKPTRNNLVLSSYALTGASSTFPAQNFTSYTSSQISTTVRSPFPTLSSTLPSSEGVGAISSALNSTINSASTALASSTQLGSSTVKPSSLQGSSVDSGASAVVETVSGKVVTETFVPTTYTEYASLTATLSTFITDAQSRTIQIVIGPGGVGWQLPSVPSNLPEIPPPTVFPSPPPSNPETSPGTITQHPSSTYTLSETDITSTTIEGVTENTKTTTSEGGHRTILPIVFCPKCGGGGGGGHGLSWIIHPPSINPPGGIEFHIPGVKWPFTITPEGDPEPLDPSEPEPEPDEDDNQSISNQSKSQETQSGGTTSGSTPTSSGASSSASSTGISSSTGSSRASGTATVATSINVDPYPGDMPQDQIAEIQSYLSSLFAAELDQVGTTLESMTTPATTGAPLSSSLIPLPSSVVSTAPSTTVPPPQSSSSAVAPPPTPKDCDCDENGCTEDSLPCCANGSCKCDCNENGCSDDSPACCANGSCPPSVAAVP
ncbi:MAG: hypothetical protein Q9214_004562 [Letrouitia sp. 1 TL-2023]